MASIKLDLILVKEMKRICLCFDFVIPADHEMKRKKKRKKSQILGSYQGAEEAVEFIDGALATVHNDLEKRLGES